MTSQLTPIGLLDALADELNKVFDGYKYKIPHDPENTKTLTDFEDDSSDYMLPVSDSSDEGDIGDDGSQDGDSQEEPEENTEDGLHDKRTDYVMRRPLRIFKQDVPINETDDDFDPAPYIIVRLKSGDDDGTADAFNTVTVIFIIAIWDDDNNSQGYRDVLNIIQKIYMRFHKDPMLNNQFMYAGNYHWALQEDNYWPYFFGACTLNFNIPSIRRENDYA